MSTMNMMNMTSPNSKNKKTRSFLGKIFKGNKKNLDLDGDSGHQRNSNTSCLSAVSSAFTVDDKNMREVFRNTSELPDWFSDMISEEDRMRSEEERTESPHGRGRAA